MNSIKATSVNTNAILMPSPNHCLVYAKVPVYAHGPGSYQFIGVHEQNALAHLIYCSACFGPYHPDCPCDSIVFYCTSTLEFGSDLYM